MQSLFLPYESSSPGAFGQNFRVLEFERRILVANLRLIRLAYRRQRQRGHPVELKFAALVILLCVSRSRKFLL